MIGSEDEELSLLEGFEPRERAGLVNDEGALEVAPLFLVAPVRSACLVDARRPAEGVVASSTTDFLLRKMRGPGRVLEAAAAGLFMLAKGIGAYLTKTSFCSEKLRKQHMHIQSLRGVSAVCGFEEILTSFWHKRGCE